MHSKANKPTYQEQVHRRSFLKRILKAGAFSVVVSSPLFAQSPKGNGKVSAGDKVNLACCGLGNRGADIIKALHATGFANIVALCDVDVGAAHTVGILNKFPEVPRFQDFRQMLDKMGKDIDAVSVGVPAVVSL